MRIALASTAILTAALAGLTAAPASAQSLVERCRAFTAIEDRLACLQISLEAVEAGVDPADIASPPPAPAPSSAAPASRPAAPAAVAPAPAAGPQGLGAEQVRQRSSNEGGGADFLGIDLPFVGGGGGDAPEADSDHVFTSIVEVREQPLGGWVFELENGQVWRQLTGDTTRVRFAPDTPTPVEMWASWAGGYRMRLLDDDMQLRVERLE